MEKRGRVLWVDGVICEGKWGELSNRQMRGEEEYKKEVAFTGIASLGTDSLSGRGS